MKQTRELKEKWTNANVKIQNKTGIMEFSPEQMLIAEMLINAITTDTPLSDNEIETIECVIREKAFRHGLLT